MHRKKYSVIHQLAARICLNYHRRAVAHLSGTQREKHTTRIPIIICVCVHSDKHAARSFSDELRRAPSTAQLSVSFSRSLQTVESGTFSFHSLLLLFFFALYFNFINTGCWLKIEIKILKQMKESAIAKKNCVSGAFFAICNLQHTFSVM